MPPIAIAAGIGAVGAIGGAAISAGAAKKASKAQTAASNAQIAQANQNRDYQYSLNSPTIDAGNAAQGTINGLLNIGGDPAAAQTSLDTFRASSGYQDLLKTGLAAVSANAYARGQGNSGASLKALQDRGANIADRSMQGYLGNLTNVASMGAQARQLVAGVGGNTTSLLNNASQGQADATGNAALASARNTTDIIGGLTNLGASALGSSYGASSNNGIYANSPSLQGLLPSPAYTLPNARIGW